MDNLLLRAWNKKEKRMYPVICINIKTKEVVVDTIAISKEYKEKIPTLKYKYPKEVLIILYMGVKDLNKKEIFEGDIVKWKVPLKEFVDNTRDCIQNDYITGIIEWIDKGCSFRIAQLTDGMNIFKFAGFTSSNHTKFYDEEGNATFNWNDVEIIGNKYDNPNLIKNNKK